jgi:hypothetical protein
MFPKLEYLVWKHTIWQTLPAKPSVVGARKVQQRHIHTDLEKDLGCALNADLAPPK